MTKKIRKYILFLVITVQENKNYQDFKICTRGFPEIIRFCLCTFTYEFREMVCQGGFYQNLQKKLIRSILS